MKFKQLARNGFLICFKIFFIKNRQIFFFLISFLKIVCNIEKYISYTFEANCFEMKEEIVNLVNSQNSREYWP